MAVNPNLLPPPPVRDPIAGKDGRSTPTWMLWWTQFYNRVGNAISVRTDDNTKLTAWDSITPSSGNLANVTPVADGTYTVGIGGSTNGIITVKSGLITAIQEAT